MGEKLCQGKNDYEKCGIFMLHSKHWKENTVYLISMNMVILNNIKLLRVLQIHKDH